MIDDRGRLLRSKGEEVDDEDDAWSIGEGIHVEDFPGEDLGRPVTDNPVDNSEWTDLVNNTFCLIETGNNLFHPICDILFMSYYIIKQ